MTSVGAMLMGKEFCWVHDLMQRRSMRGMNYLLFCHCVSVGALLNVLSMAEFFCWDFWLDLIIEVKKRFSAKVTSLEAAG